MNASTTEPLVRLKTSLGLLPPTALAIITLAARVFCHGSVYFADGPAHISSILDKVYIIQPPGYWLFNRIAGLFANPVTGISVMNILFSVAGVVVFYYTALFFTERRNAFLAALAYSSIFYIWFSGEVHSTYASQALFPVATFWVLLSYDRDNANWRLWLAAAIFAVGAGLRPSDGVFLIPMLVYFSVVRLPGKKAGIFLILISVMCLAWVIPTGLAYRNAYGGMGGVSAYMLHIMKVRSITTGVNTGSLADIARYVFPLLVGFWPLLFVAAANVIRNGKDWRVRMMLVWIVPGSLFFVLSYIADAPYLNFLSAAILLLAVRAPRMMAITAIWNAALFLTFAPIPSQRLVVNVWNCDIGKYTFYAIRHHWQPNLSTVQTQVSRNLGREGLEPKGRSRQIEAVDVTTTKRTGDFGESNEAQCGIVTDAAMTQELL
ncbi:MAG: glycosyltransferase family 39 protein [Terracidiphilus sp.]